MLVVLNICIYTYIIWLDVCHWLQPFHNRAAPLTTVRWIPASMRVYVLTPPLDLPARVRRAMREPFASMQWIRAAAHHACMREPAWLYQGQDTIVLVWLDMEVNKLSLHTKLLILSGTTFSDKDSVPSHYLNQCWNIVNWNFRNKLQWNFNRNSNIFIQENALENVVCEMASILSRPQCDNCTWKGYVWCYDYFSLLLSKVRWCGISKHALMVICLDMTVTS